jgi:hypothetical protein
MPSKKSKQSKSANKKPKGLKIAAKKIAKTPRRNGSSSSIPRGLTSSAAVYAVALTKPFSDASYGARVPDMYSAPTATHHIRRLVTVKADSDGNFSALVMPSIYQHMIIPTGTTASNNGTDFTAWNGAGIVKSYGLVASGPAANFAKLSNHRIVAYGVRIRNINSMTDVKGRFSVAKIAIKDDMIVPSRAAVGTLIPQAYFTRKEWYLAAGIPTQGTLDDFSTSGFTIDPDTLQTLPQSVTVSNLELAQKGLEIVPKITTPYAFSFRNTADSKAGNDPSPGIATGAINVGDDDYIKFGGFESILLAGSGLTPSAACYTIELIYHVEGTPTITDDTIGSLGLTADTPVLSVVNMAAFNKAIDVASRAASFCYPSIAVSNMAFRMAGSGLAMIGA